MLDATREKMTNAHYHILKSAFHQTIRGNPRTLIIPMLKSNHYEMCLTFELLIKVLYEIGNGKEYQPYPHNIQKIYNDLDDSHREKIKYVYNSEKHKLQLKLRKQNARQIIIDTNVMVERKQNIKIRKNEWGNAKFQTLTEALESNENTMTSEKYSYSQIDKTSIISSIHFQPDQKVAIQIRPGQKVAVQAKELAIEPVSDFIPLLYDYCDSLIYDESSNIINDVKKIRKNNGEINTNENSRDFSISIFYNTRTTKI